jgi:hypothetical protein
LTSIEFKGSNKSFHVQLWELDMLDFDMLSSNAQVNETLDIVV